MKKEFLAAMAICSSGCAPVETKDLTSAQWDQIYDIRDRIDLTSDVRQQLIANAAEEATFGIDGEEGNAKMQVSMQESVSHVNEIVESGRIVAYESKDVMDDDGSYTAAQWDNSRHEEKDVIMVAVNGDKLIADTMSVLLHEVGHNHKHYHSSDVSDIVNGGNAYEVAGSRQVYTKALVDAVIDSKDFAYLTTLYVTPIDWIYRSYREDRQSIEALVEWEQEGMAQESEIETQFEVLAARFDDERSWAEYQVGEYELAWWLKEFGVTQDEFVDMLAESEMAHEVVDWYSEARAEFEVDMKAEQKAERSGELRSSRERKR